MNVMVILFLSIFYSTTLQAITATDKQTTRCNIHFTEKQVEILELARSVGYIKNLEWELPAIAMQESFVGKSVVRHREVSAHDTSYGITHFKPSTATYVASKRKLYPIVPSEVKLLLESHTGDVLSLHLTLEYLTWKRERGYSWDRMIGSYNAGKYWNHSMGRHYVSSVVNNMKYLQNCVAF